jgi:hypothetical protein
VNGLQQDHLLGNACGKGSWSEKRESITVFLVRTAVPDCLTSRRILGDNHGSVKKIHG